MKDIKTIVVPVDFSDSSDNAFQMALSIAMKYQAKLIALHVVDESIDLHGYYFPHISFEKLEEELAEGAQKLMTDFCKRKLYDYENHQGLVVSGLPHDKIIATARVNNADMIIMGTHGRSGFDHVLFGSTAEKVVRKSPIPVLTVRLEETE